MDEEFEVLLDLLVLEENKVRILVWNCNNCIEQILGKYPKVELHCTGIDDSVKQLKCLNDKIFLYDLDDNRENLPFQEEYFDYIILGRGLERVQSPKNFIKMLFKYLAVSGKLLATFGNLRHWSMLKNLSNGIWKYEETGILQKGTRYSFVLKEIIKLFERAHYQELQFASIRKVAPKKFLEDLAHTGFKNENGDLEVSIWIVKACKIDEVSERLKKSFSPLVRRKLVYLLRRIDGEVELQKNTILLWQYCCKENISIHYLAEFIQNATLNPIKVFTIIAIEVYRQKNVNAAMDLLRLGGINIGEISEIVSNA